MAGTRRAEIALAIVPLALALLTFGVLFNADVAPVIQNERLALAIDAVATLVAVAVAVLGWIRYREAADETALWRGSALLVLGAMNVLTATVTVLGVERAFGLSVEDPGQLPLWTTILAREVAGLLLVIAGLAAVGRWRAQRLPPLLTLWLPALLTTALALLAAGFQDVLPPLISDAGLQAIRNDPSNPLPAGAAAPLILMEILVALAYLAAAGLSYRAYRVNGRVTDAVLTAGLMLAAFSQVLFAIHPATYSSLISPGDFLRVAFYATLLATLAVEVRGDIRALRTANQELTTLREAEVMRATADERAHLAREIHDGMSQELWYAKLKQRRLLALPQVDGDARELATEVATAIESALAEARQAILALRPVEGATFAEVIERYVSDFADRFGIAADCRCDPAADQLPARSKAELLRIVQEALANVRKHADATRVRVDLSADGGSLSLRISDNGRGFSAADGRRSGYGLTSMEQRATLIGGTFAVESRPQDGTSVLVRLPAAEA